MIPTDDFLILLKSELAERFRKNPRYSLRAFARDLGISPARLSEILSGKKGLSGKRAKEIALRLDLTPEETEVFCDLVERKHARSRAAKTQAEIRIDARLAAARSADGKTETTHNLALEAFRLIEDWYPLAILEYLKIENCAYDSDSIARHFRLSVHQVTDAIARLYRLELLTDVDARPIPVNDWVLNRGSVPSRSIRKHHEQVLSRAADALYSRSLAERSFRTSIFSMNLERMPEIEREMKEFSLALIKKYSATENSCEVVAFALQVFPLSNRNPLPTKESLP